MKETKSSNRPNSFENFFSEAFHYGDGYGYAVNAKNEREAIDKIVEYLGYEDRGKDSMHRLKREIRENMRESWVRFQGFLADDGEFHNGWTITSEWMGGKRGWKKVFESDYNRHYVVHGHRYEPKADENGNRVNYSFNEWNCDVCNQLHSIVNRHREATWEKSCLIADEFYSASPKYRTKDRLTNLINENVYWKDK